MFVCSKTVCVCVVKLVEFVMSMIVKLLVWKDVCVIVYVCITVVHAVGRYGLRW